MIQGFRRRPGFLVALLLLMLMGCTRTKMVQAPVETGPQSRRVPVKVTTGPTKPERPPEKPKVKEVAPEPGEEDRALEGFATRLKKIPTAKRTPAKGEKVFPIDLNLKNADLVEAVRVLGDTLGLNYSIDPRVKGTANVRASGKLTQTELLSILETILYVNGATMIKLDNLYKIVPLDKAATGSLPVVSRGEVPPGMRAQVVFLEQTSGKDMVTALKPLMSAGGSITETAHNALILIDTPDNLDKLLHLVQLVDTRGLEQTLIRLAKVHNTDPGEIIGELETIFSAYGTLAPKEKGRFGVSFMPVARLNSVMVLASSTPLMDRALYWVRQLDLRTDMMANVHIYNVENYKAKNLANLLTQVYGGQPTAPTVKETKPETGVTGGFQLGGRTGGGMGGAGGAGGMGGVGGLGGTSGLGGGGLGTGGMGGIMGGTSTGTGALPPAPGAAAAEAPLKERAMPGAAAGAGVSPKEGVRIIPDEENNLLVIVAPPHEWNIISRILKSLDIIPRQVLNEVLIAEVDLTGDLKYGVEWRLGMQPTPTTTGGTAATAITSPPATVPGVDILPGASAAFSALGGLTFVATDALNKFRGLINLLASEGKVNVLASPQIMAANNQEARIQIGQDVPILTSESTPLISQQTSFTTQTVQYRSTGVILAVKPQINAKGLVTLDITQEVSNALPLTPGQTSPTISVRQAKTSLITGDNQTVVLGGMIREDRTHTQAGIPGLRRIPLLGPLFGSEGYSKARTELLVLITPHIVANLEEGARITQGTKDKMGLEEPLPTRRGLVPSVP